MPNERPYTVCLTFDFDALSVWLGGYPSPTPAMLSRGEWGARVAVPRILNLLAAYGIPATFLVPGHTTESFPGAVDAILVAGHQVAQHSCSHRNPSTESPDDERRDLERGLAVLERVLRCPPLGYRSPAWDYSAATLSLLVEHGFLYDSSLFAGDYHPYYPCLGAVGRASKAATMTEAHGACEPPPGRPPRAATLDGCVPAIGCAFLRQTDANPTTCGVCEVVLE